MERSEQMQWTFRRSMRLGGYPRKELGEVGEKVRFRFLGLVPFIGNKERGSCLEGRRTENKSDKGEKGTLSHHGQGAFQSSSQVTGLGYTVTGRKELEGFTEGFRSEKELEFNAENYLSRKLSHTVNPRKSMLETGKAAETKSLPNNGRISPEKQRLPVSTKLASCPGDSVSRRRSSAPPFPIQISARRHFPSIRGLLLPGRTSYYPASAPGLSARAPPHQAPRSGSSLLPPAPPAWLSSLVSTARPPHPQLSLPPPASTLPAWPLGLGPASRPPSSAAPAGSPLPGRPLSGLHTPRPAAHSPRPGL